MKLKDQSLNMHRFFVIAGIMTAYYMVLLTTVSGGQLDVVHICCYSTDPSSYEPKCYDCKSRVYKDSLMACINMTDLPKNISFKAANCLEKNCQIQLPETSDADVMTKNPLFSILQFLRERSKRSLFDNNVAGSSTDKHVVKEVSTFVTREVREIKFDDPEYFG